MCYRASEVCDVQWLDLRREGVMNEEEEIEDLFDDEYSMQQETPQCPLCGGQGTELDTHENLTWYRCTSCGRVYHQPEHA